MWGKSNTSRKAAHSASSFTTARHVRKGNRKNQVTEEVSNVSIIMIRQSSIIGRVHRIQADQLGRQYPPRTEHSQHPSWSGASSVLEWPQLVSLR